MIERAGLLVVRDDKLGDVLLSLPALRLLKDSAPQFSISFYCREAVLAILKPTLDAWGIQGLCSMPSSAEMRRYEAVLFLHGSLSMALTVWWCGVKWRSGQYTKPWSFVFYNVGIRQRRSLAEKNEAEYTLDVVKYFLERLKIPLVNSAEPVRLVGDVEASQAAEKILAGDGGPFAVVHPGMGGSALNVTPKVYAEIVLELKGRGYEVFLSEGPEDKKIVAEVLSIVTGTKVIRGVSLSVLSEIFRKAKWVVAPSTGPLHLAHYSGTGVIGLYPPIPSQHPRRWRPWGGAGKVTVLYPQVTCPAKKACLLKGCELYNCMETYPWLSRLREICL